MEFRIVRLETTDSTMKAARRLPDAPSGTVVVAGSQTEGAGTKGRRWLSEHGGLYFTLVLREKYAPGIMLHFNLLIASSVASVLRSVDIASASVLWPNDVVCTGGKVAGVMAEGEVLHSVVDPLLVGVGLNVNNDISAIRKSGVWVSSLREETGRELSVDNLLEECLQGIGDALRDVDDQAAVLSRVRTVLQTGMPVEVESMHGVFDAVLGGITDDFLPVFRNGSSEMTLGRTEVTRIRPLRIRQQG